VTLFLWAMGVCGVFVADVGNEALGECSCYYSFPAIPALAALVTPLALCFNFIGKCEFLGMSFLFGDYLYSITYHFPHHLARQSMLWTWGTLTVPFIQGTEDQREDEEHAGEDDLGQKLMPWTEQLLQADPGSWWKLFYLVRFVYVFRISMLCIISLAAAPFLVKLNNSFLQLTSEYYFAYPAFAVFARVWLVTPSILTVVFGLWIILWTYDQIDKGDLIKDMIDVDRIAKVAFEKRRYVFSVLTVFHLIMTVVCAYGLWPLSQRLANPLEYEQVGLLTTEAWCSCGWVLFTQILVAVTSNVYIMEPEINFLHHLGEENLTKRELRQREKDRLFEPETDDHATKLLITQGKVEDSSASSSDSDL